MSETAAEIALKYAGKAGKKFESLTDPPKPEIDPTEKARLTNTALRTTKFLSQEAYFNPDKINDYGRRDAGPEIELFDPDTRIPVARIAREPKSGGPAIWQSSSYNPDLEYQQVTKDGYISEIDPQTGREVARTANLVGGADGGEIPPTKPPAPADGTGGGDLPPSKPPAPSSPEGGGDGPDNPYDRLNYVELEQTLADKQAALDKAERNAAINPLLANLPKARENLNNLRTAVSQIEDSRDRLLDDPEAREPLLNFDDLVAQEVDYRLREGQPLSTATTDPERELYEQIQLYLQSEEDSDNNIFSNLRLEGAIKARYEVLTKEYEKQFAEALTPTPETAPTTDDPATPPEPSSPSGDGSSSPDAGIPPTAPTAGTEPVPDDEPDESSPDDSSPTPPDIPPTTPPPPPAAPPAGVSISTTPTETSPAGPPPEPPTEVSPEGPPPPPSTETFASLQSKIDPILRIRNMTGTLTPAQQELLNRFQRQQSQILEKYAANPEASLLIDTASGAIDAYIANEITSLVHTAEPVSDPIHIKERESMLESYLTQYPELNGYLRQVYNERLRSAISRRQTEIDNRRTEIEDEKKEEAERRASDADRRQQAQLDAINRLTEQQRLNAQQAKEDADRRQKEAYAKDHPHDEALSSTDPKIRREYIDNMLFNYEHVLSGINDAKIQELRARMTTLGVEKELIDLLDARILLQDAAGAVPVEGAFKLDKWEDSMKGLFVVEGSYLKLLIGGKWVDRDGNEITDVNRIAAKINRPHSDRDIEWKRSENVPGLQEAMSILQNEPHTEQMEVDEIDYRTSPPSLTGRKTKITTVCNFFQGDSSADNLKTVKKTYQDYLQDKRPELTLEQADTAIHLAERLLRVTLIGARMNGPLRQAPQIKVLKDGKEKFVEDYDNPETTNLASRRINLSLTTTNNDPTLTTTNNAPTLKKYDPSNPNDWLANATSSIWDTIYAGTHSSIKIDTEATLSGVIKGRGTAFREALYFPAFLEQRNLGGYPELRRMTNLRISDFLANFTDAAKDTGVGEVVDFDKFVQTYSNFQFGNKQNILNFWVENVKNAMDNKSLFYAEPKKKGEKITGLVADPISISKRVKIMDLSFEYTDIEKDGSKNELDARTALGKYQEEITEFSSEFASIYYLAYPGLPKDKIKHLIWLEQQFYQFITSQAIGQKYFHQSSNKRKGKDIVFYLAPKPPNSTKLDDAIGADAFTYGFYKNENLNITEEIDDNIYAIREAVIKRLDPGKVPTGKTPLNDSNHPVSIGLNWLGKHKK